MVLQTEHLRMEIGVQGGIHIFFISKKDVFYFFLIWGCIIVGFLTMVYPIFSVLSMARFILLFFGLIIIGWLIWIWFSTGYLIKNKTLEIIAGPFKQVVNIQEIKNITKEKSVLTAASLSTDRIVIHYSNYKYAHISPKKEYEFIKLLLSKNTQIQIDSALSKRYNF